MLIRVTGNDKYHMKTNPITNTDFPSFISELKNEERFNELAPELALIKPGQWAELVRWAESCGFQFTLKDIESFANECPQMFDNIPEDSNLSEWNMSTLSECLKSI